VGSPEVLVLVLVLALVLALALVRHSLAYPNR